MKKVVKSIAMNAAGLGIIGLFVIGVVFIVLSRKVYE